MTTIHLIAAARPNFMKVAPLYHALKAADWCTPVLIHTGQHYDANMSDAFFEDLKLPDPDHHLGVGSGSHAEQTAGVMVAYEQLCMEHRPDCTIVVGDVNSTIACTLAAKKLHIPVAHLEAGLRSGDRTMPEEINRILTDSVADLLWTPSPDGDANLKREGVADERIARVGNIMIDSFEMMRGPIEAADTPGSLGLQKGTYGVVTLHRPANVDTREALTPLVERLIQAAQNRDLVFPLHPRTKSRMESFGLLDSFSKAKGIHIVEPMGYIPFMSLVSAAKLVITDSGGIQEETTYLNIPCLTLRTTTERPITIDVGSNKLISCDELLSSLAEIESGDWPQAQTIDLWDGATAGRVASSLKGFLKI